MIPIVPDSLETQHNTKQNRIKLKNIIKSLVVNGQEYLRDLRSISKGNRFLNFC